MHEILGLDPGDNIGFARIGITEEREIKLLDYGIVAILDNLVSDCRKWLEQYIEDHHVHCIAYESITYGQKCFPNIIRTIQVQGIIEMVAYDYTITTHAYVASSVKAAIAGGQARKEKVRRALKRFMNIEHSIQSNHITDAIATACCAALREYRAKWPAQPAEQPELPLSATHKPKRRKPKPQDLTDDQILQAIRDGRAEIDDKGKIVGIR